LTIKKNIFIIMAFKGVRVTCFIWALRVLGSCLKEGVMKRSLVWSVGLAMSLLAMATWVSAASMDDIAGTWGVYTKAKGSVRKLGTNHSEGLGAIQFRKDSYEQYVGFFTYNERGGHDAGGYTYTGYFDLTPDGKKLTLEFDDDGLLEFEAMMADWLQRAAAGKWLVLDNITFVYDEKGIVMSTVKTSKKTNGPTKGTVSAKGVVWAHVWDRGTYIGYIPGKFSFKSTTKFLTKQHP
jgi:hypothetical protein